MDLVVENLCGCGGGIIFLIINSFTLLYGSPPPQRKKPYRGSSLYKIILVREKRKVWERNIKLMNSNFFSIND